VYTSSVHASRLHEKTYLFFLGFSSPPAHHGQFLSTGSRVGSSAVHVLSGAPLSRSRPTPELCVDPAEQRAHGATMLPNHRRRLYVLSPVPEGPADTAAPPKQPAHAATYCPPPRSAHRHPKVHSS
jgi:hypothetical protein